jgi:hypothetical protein
VEAQPSVIVFNTFVAGAGWRRVRGTESPPARRAFSFTDGTVWRNTLSGNRRREICGDVLPVESRVAEDQTTGQGGIAQ